MNMKKIMASVAASALAVSAMATAAFAADDIVATATAPTAYTSAVVTFKSVSVNATMTSIKLDKLGSDFTANSITPVIKVNGIAGVDGASDTTWTPAPAPAVGDPTAVVETAKSLDVTLVYTFAATSDVSAFETYFKNTFKADSADAATLTVNSGAVALNYKEATYKFVEDTNDTAANSVSDVKLSNLNDGKGLSVSQKAALKANAGSTVEFELKKAAAADTKFIVSIKTADDTFISKAEVTVAKGETTGKATFTATETYDPEFEVAAGLVRVQDTNWTDTALIKSITWTIAAEAASDETDPEESDVSDEETDATLEGEDTAAEGEDTAAEGEDTAAEGSDSKGENPGTGVALAIVPAIVAGAAVVASRKRK